MDDSGDITDGSPHVFPQDTLHWHNIYTTQEDSLTIPIQNQDDILTIAQQQTLKWYPDTILQTSKVVTALSGSSDAKPSAQQTDHLTHLDTHSTHVVYSRDDDASIDVATFSAFHPTHPSYVPKPHLGESHPVVGGYHVNSQALASHPLVAALSSDDQIYLTTLYNDLETSPALTALRPVISPKHPTIHLTSDKYQPVEVVSSPFPQHLSLFQLHSLAAVLQHHHVLVTAHTGSGKTMNAHGVIYHTLASGGRVVYTTPIKALSNQKYAELSSIYPDVGILTGDVNVNPTASIVVMTTEILRNQSIHSQCEFAAAIFDEIHYMEDMSRGVIWEETILTLPLTTQMVFLSATVVNADEFAKWIASVTHRPCHVVGTKQRTVPIAHLVLRPPENLPRFPRFTADDQQGVVAQFESLQAPTASDTPDTPDTPDTGVDGVGAALSPATGAPTPSVETDLTKSAELSDSAPQPVGSTVNPRQDGPEARSSSLPSTSGGTLIHPLSPIEHHLDFPASNEDDDLGGDPKSVPSQPSHMLFSPLVSAVLTAISNHWLPLIVFSFIRKDCDYYAMRLFQLGFRLTTPAQRLRICQLCEKYLSHDTPNRAYVIQLLSSGIATHHSGLLPRVREVVEKLLEYSLIKLLFATETFAVGINVPVRTVLFTNVSKYDGQQNRLLTSAEYTQMSGRAGRRGMDTVGISLTIHDPVLTLDVYKSIVCGGALCLQSRFRVSIGLLLSSILSSSHSSGTSSLDDDKTFNFYEHINNNISSVRQYRRYDIAQVIESSFAIFRFSRHNHSRLQLLVARALLWYCQRVWLLSRLHQVAGGKPRQSLPADLAQMLGEFETIQKLYDVEGAHGQGIDPFLRALNDIYSPGGHVGPMASVDIFKMPLVDFITNDKGYMLFNPSVHVGSLLHLALPPAISNALQQHLEYALSVEGLAGSPTYNRDAAIHILSLFTTVRLPHDDDGDDDDNEPPEVDNLTITTRPEATPSPHAAPDVPDDLAGTQGSRSQEGAHPLLDPISYCQPGRIVYVDFPGDLHDENHTHPLLFNTPLDQQYSTSTLCPPYSAYAPSPFVPRCLGWGVVLGVNVSTMQTVSVDILLPMVAKRDVDDSAHSLTSPPGRLHVIRVCECGISKISHLRVHMPLTQITSYNDFIAIWSSVLHAKLALAHFVTTSPQLLHSSSQRAVASLEQQGPTTTHREAFCSPQQILSLTEFPVLYSRDFPLALPSAHNALGHSHPSLLFDTPDATDTTSTSDLPLSVQALTDVCQLFSATMSLPASAADFTLLLFTAQSLWIHNKAESFKHAMTLATTSFNNPNGSDPASTPSAEPGTEDERRLLSYDGGKDQQTPKPHQGRGIRDLVTRYIQTVHAMTAYLLQCGYIQPLHVDKVSMHRDQPLFSSGLSSHTFSLTHKGKVCSYIDNPNGIIITELLFNNAFHQMQPSELAAILSVFVTSRNASDQNVNLSAISKNIHQVYEKITNLCMQLDLLQSNMSSETQTAKGDQSLLDETLFLDSSAVSAASPSVSATMPTQTASIVYDSREIGLSLVPHVYLWCETHDLEKSLNAEPGPVYAGNLSRVLHRLIDVIDQVEKGVEAIGDVGLQEKLSSLRTRIQTGTLFESSLHLLELQQQVTKRRSVS